MSRCPSVRRLAAIGIVGLIALSACSSSISGGARGPASTTAAASASTTSGASTTTAPPTTTESSGAVAPPCSPRQVVEQWPIERRAAQVLVIPSHDFNVTALRQTIERGVGGVLFLGRAPAPDDLRARIDAVATSTDPAPAFQADQEGGGVQRLKGQVESLPWARDMGATMDDAEIEAVAQRTGERMKELGVGVDLAPVLDVDDRPGPSETNPAGDRSFGATAEDVTSSGLAFFDGLLAAGVVPVVKHFPGLGGSTANTDDHPATTRPIDELREVDLRPFEAAIHRGAPAVMVALATVPGLTDQPAALSPEVVQGLLREELGFEGLVVTDSLSAVAIRETGLTLPQAAVAALAAGSDQILFGGLQDAREVALLQPSAVDATAVSIIAAIRNAVADGHLSEARLDDAVEAVLQAKDVDLCA